MPFKLNVPYEQKDSAKKLGAKWNGKTWYIPDNEEHYEFKEWFEEDFDVIIKKPYYFAFTRRECWKCKKLTPIIGFLGINYLFLENPYEYECEPFQDETVSIISADKADEIINESFGIIPSKEDETYSIEKRVFNCPTYFVYVKEISSNIKEIIESFFSFYYKSSIVADTYWVNHCIHCNIAQEGNSNFDKKKGNSPFYPLSEDEMKKIRFVELPLEFDIGLCGIPEPHAPNFNKNQIIDIDEISFKA